MGNQKLEACPHKKEMFDSKTALASLSVGHLEDERVLWGSQLSRVSLQNIWKWKASFWNELWGRSMKRQKWSTAGFLGTSKQDLGREKLGISSESSDQKEAEPLNRGFPSRPAKSSRVWTRARSAGHSGGAKFSACLTCKGVQMELGREEFLPK